MTEGKYYKPCSTCHNADCVWMGGQDTHKKCEDYQPLEQEPIIDKIREIVDEWQPDTWTDNLSYECMVKIAELIEP